MTIEEARRIIRDDSASRIGWLAATTVITAEESFSGTQSFMDYIYCLRRGSPCASSACITLYCRSQRPLPDNVQDYSHDANEWEDYLQNHGLLDDSEGKQTGKGVAHPRAGVNRQFLSRPPS